jgi:tripartite ATP-independent transporter DctM subunit
MELIVLFGAFFLLMILGCPLGYAMGITSLIYMVAFQSSNLIMIPQELAGGANSFPLLAVPFFILAGLLMNNLGVTERLFDFARKLVGHLSGGLGYVNVLSSMLFAGMSGSAVADAGGLGAIEVKAMTQAGYSRRFSAAITAASACIGPIIPPSIIIIVYAILAEVSVAKLFMGAIIPGILMGISLMVMIYIRVKMKKEVCPVDPKASLKEVMISFKRAILPLCIPLILVLGILLGVYTPTEAGASGVVITLVLGAFYREFRWKEIFQAIEETIKGTVTTLFFIASAGIFTWILTIEKVPETIVSGLISVTDNKYIVLFLIVLALLILGMFMSIEATLILVLPVLLVIAETYGIDLVHMGIFVILTLMVGMISPPVGICLFIVSEIAEIKYADLCKSILPYIIPIVVVVLLVTYIPSLVTLLPSIFL